MAVVSVTSVWELLKNMIGPVSTAGVGFNVGVGLVGFKDTTLLGLVVV